MRCFCIYISVLYLGWFYLVKVDMTNLHTLPEPLQLAQLAWHSISGETLLDTQPSHFFLQHRLGRDIGIDNNWMLLNQWQQIVFRLLRPQDATRVFVHYCCQVNRICKQKTYYRCYIEKKCIQQLYLQNRSSILLEQPSYVLWPQGPYNTLKGVLKSSVTLCRSKGRMTCLCQSHHNINNRFAVFQKNFCNMCDYMVYW